MAKAFALACRKCGSRFSFSSVVPGRLAPCPKCDGSLALMGKAVLTCSTCRSRSKPMAVEISRPLVCAKCHSALTLAEMETALPSSPPATSEKPTLKVIPRQTAGDDATLAPQATPAEVRKGATSQTRDAEGEALILAPKGMGETRFGKYLLQGEIGRGGMGVVYRAFDPDLKRHVALKLLIAGEAADEENTRRFIREARAAGRLRHPHIVAVHDAGCIDGKHYYTMDLIEGADLADHIYAAERNVPFLIRRLIEACQALHAAHEAGIVHRDLKPANIMIDRSGKAVVMDFGLAKDLASLSLQSLSGAVMGTPAYMSPEQAQGRSHDIDRRSDIYSMGVILYELATGQRPFAGDTVLDTLQAVVTQEPPAPRQIRRHIALDLERIILKCLEKEPERRYATMLELAEDLQRYLGGEPVSARPAGALRRLWRRTRRSRAAFAVVVAALLLILAAVLGFLAHGDAIAVASAEVSSGDRRRMTAAMVVLQAQIQENRLDAAKERDRLCGLLLKIVGGPSEEAEKIALALIGKWGDASAASQLITTAGSSNLTADRRAAILNACGDIALQAAERESLAGLLAAILANDRMPAEARAAAAEALAAQWCSPAAEALRRVACDAMAPTLMRCAAIAGLGKHASLLDASTAVLFQALADADEEVRAAAAAALAQARPKTSLLDFYGIGGNARAALAGAAEVVAVNTQRQQEMLDMLENSGADTGAALPSASEAVAPLLAKLKSADALERAAAAYDLGVLQAESASAALLTMLTDTEVSVRRAAAAALARIAAKVGKDRIDAGRIIPLLQHDDLLVRENAALLLADLKPASSLPALCQAIGKERSSRCLKAMAGALAHFKDREAAEALASAAKKAPAEVAVACVRSLAAQGKIAVPFLVQLFTLDKPALRQLCREALKEISGEDFGEDVERWRRWMEGG